MWACNFSFVLDMSVCFRIFACLFCKILIAHCIYEGSYKISETWWKMLQYVYEIPHSVLMMCPLFSVLVSWMNYQISSFFPLYLPNAVDTRSTRGSNCIHHSFHGTVRPYCKTLDCFFLIALSSVGFVCQAIMWSDLHLGKCLGNGYWVVMLSTVVALLPASVILSRSCMFCRIPGFLGGKSSVLSAFDPICVDFSGLK